MSFTPTTSQPAVDADALTDCSSSTACSSSSRPRSQSQADYSQPDDDSMQTPRTPRSFLRPRSRSLPSGSGLQPLLKVTAGINGRLGLATSTTLTITKATLVYGRYEVPLEEIEQAAYDEVTSTLVLKFSFRPKPKHFVLDSPASCRAVCQLLGQLLESIDNGTTPSYEELMQQHGAADDDDTSLRASQYLAGPPPPVQTPDSVQEGRYSTHGAMPTGMVSPPITPPPPPLLPAWLVSILDCVHCRECGEMAYSRVRGGGCCRDYVLEATLFGVLMPLALAGYWLSDANGLGAETGKHDEHGRDRWMAAECVVTKMMIVPRQVYHHGKFADAKDVAYQEGRVWRLELAYNASVTLKQTLYDASRPTFRDWPATWWSAVHTTPTTALRPHCDGQVLQTEREVRLDCGLRKWIPDKFRHLNWTGTQDCFVDRSDRTLVYLDVHEPLSFYLDLVLIGIMLAIALSFTVCLVVQHRKPLARLLQAARHSLFPPADGASSTPADGEQGQSSARSTGQLRPPLTPATLKSAYRHVVRGFHEMV